MQMQTIAERLKWARGHSGLTQKEVSDRAGLSDNHVGFIEQERFKSVNVKTASAIAGVFGVSTEWLLLGVEPDPTPEQIASAAKRQGAA